MTTAATKELNALRSKIKQLAKERNFLTEFAERTWISFTHISLFKDWKKSLSIENFFLVKKTLDEFESEKVEKK